MATLIVTSASMLLKRTVSQVEADIAGISNQTTSLNNAIKSFANSSASAAVALREALSTGAVSETDARTILTSVEAFEPTIIDTLTNIVSNKAALQALTLGGIPALVLSDLRTLNTSTAAFESSLLAAAPVSQDFRIVPRILTVSQTDLLSEGRQVQANITDAFNKAIAAYA
ncbi:hypothetical protein H0H87_007105 [Tephrocybe sp. NHM501043]|nr:hypothetical protein H0H87_007105 [Tephrocybe sp. NHM501043]